MNLNRLAKKSLFDSFSVYNYGFFDRSDERFGANCQDAGWRSKSYISRRHHRISFGKRFKSSAFPRPDLTDRDR